MQNATFYDSENKIQDSKSKIQSNHQIIESIALFILIFLLLGNKED